MDIKTLQKDFLEAFVSFGTIRAACKSAGVDRDTVKKWRKGDDFRAKFDNAKDDFREQLEEIAFQRLRDQTSKDNPVLLITLLNAHFPERYRPKEAPVNEDAKEFMMEMRQMWHRLPEESEEEIVNPTIDNQLKRILDKKRGGNNGRPSTSPEN